MKACSKCGIKKDDSQFKTRYAQCNDCLSKRRHETYQHRSIELKEKNLCVTCEKNSRHGKSIYCLDCSERRNAAQRKVSFEIKKQCVEYKGGKCEDCGLVTEHYIVYDFHHVDRKTKDAKVAELIHKRKDFEVIKIELDKCVLLCSNCHRIHHENEAGL